jgi:DNA-binding NtrC family response regulator
MVRLMHTEEATKTIILASAKRPEPGMQREMEAHAIRVHWVHSIEAAAALLDAVLDGTLVITELALKDGNWRDLVECVRCTRRSIRIALLSPTRTQELWWDALEYGVEDILPAPLSVSRIYEYLGK